MICGIYKYQNKINGKIYIGQSVDIEARYRGHKSASFNPKDKDYNMVIHQAIRKYGLENFDFQIIEKCPQGLLNEREVYWIKYYNSYHKGYNATEGGDESHIHLGKPIELFDMKGNYVTEYPNITEAAKAIGVSRNTLYGIIQGERLSAKGYQFRLKGDTTPVQEYKNRQGGKKSVYQCAKTSGSIIKEWESAAAAARDLGLDSSTITKVCKGKLKSTGGFGWRYKEE